ncbi:MAG: MDR family oxidoreductase [Cyanobacteria bacterium J06638_6]
MAKRSFSALIVDRQPDDTRGAVKITELTSVDSLPHQADGLLIRVTHSCLNYKDALAITGRGKVLKNFPIVPGIDLAGVVEQADANNVFQPGNEVLVTGFGVGEKFSGGYAEFCSVNTDWVLPMPLGFSAQDCMAVGTAGLTAMLSVLALEKHGVRPEQGPVLVTGAAGGVGSIAILILSKCGYEVIAVSGRVKDQGEYLRYLGAAQLINREELAAPSSKPLDSERWAGAIDTVGGDTLASILRQTKYRGSVAACGLAGGVSLPTTVLPFILRGVNLLGIDSVMCPRPLREEAWKRLSEDLDREKLQTLYNVISLREVPDMSEQLLLGNVRGRVVVELGV